MQYPFATTEAHVQALLSDPLGQITKDLLLVGLEPQLAVAELVYLTKISNYAGRPLSLQVLGDSEVGKSTTVGLVLELHPPEDQLALHSITWASLMEGADGSRDFRRRVIWFDEHVDRQADARVRAALRELRTKPRVCRSKVEGNSTLITLLGPAATIDTSLTDQKYTYEDASRCLRIMLHDDEPTRQLVSQLNAERFDPAGEERQNVARQIAEAHTTFFRLLRKDLVIYKPPMLDGTGVSPRFDSAVMSLTCTAAWLDQNNLQLKNNRTTASARHYAHVYDLLSRVQVVSSQSELSPSARGILSAWQEHIRLHGNLSISTVELHAAVAPGMDPGAFGRLVKHLRDDNYAAVVGRGPRGLHSLQLTRIGEGFRGGDLIARLPSPESLAAAQDCAGERAGQIVAEPEVTPDSRDDTDTPEAAV